MKIWTRPASSAQRWFSAAVLLVAGVVASLLAWRHPIALGIPTCPFLAVTGLYCPGCGSLRASHHLLHFHWLDAWLHNPLLVFFAPLLAVWLLAHLDTVLRGQRWGADVPSVLGRGLLVLIFGYWLVRNLPFEFLDVLRPPG